MEIHERDQPKGLGREARQGAGAGPSVAAPNRLAPPPQPMMDRAGVLRLLTSRVLPADEWRTAVFYDNNAYPNLNVLKLALQAKGYGLPTHVYGSRSIKKEFSTQAVLEFIFPHGVPESDRISTEMRDCLRDLFQSVKKVYDCPGIEQSEIDINTIIVCKEKEFINMMENVIAKSGQKL